jgi:hypothetical protein
LPHYVASKRLSETGKPDTGTCLLCIKKFLNEQDNVFMRSHDSVSAAFDAGIDGFRPSGQPAFAAGSSLQHAACGRKSPAAAATEYNCGHIRHRTGCSRQDAFDIACLTGVTGYLLKSEESRL